MMQLQSPLPIRAMRGSNRCTSPSLPRQTYCPTSKAAAQLLARLDSRPALSGSLQLGATQSRLELRGTIPRDVAHGLDSLLALGLDVAAVDARAHVLHNHRARAAVHEDAVDTASANSLSPSLYRQATPADTEGHNLHISQPGKGIFILLVQICELLLLLLDALLQLRLLLAALLAVDLLLAEARVRA